MFLSWKYETSSWSYSIAKKSTSVHTYTTDVKLGTRGHWIRTQTGAGVTATLV
jgi:hypothetical protein